jgi:hypothetical protein
VAVLGLVAFLYYFLVKISHLSQELEKKVSLAYLATISLIVLEIFLAMSLWPVDPKTKALVIVIVFYLSLRLIYLNAHHVLNLKRASGFVITSLLILAGIIALGWWLGF